MVNWYSLLREHDRERVHVEYRNNPRLPQPWFKDSEFGELMFVKEKPERMWLISDELLSEWKGSKESVEIGICETTHWPQIDFKNAGGRLIRSIGPSSLPFIGMGRTIWKISSEDGSSDLLRFNLAEGEGRYDIACNGKVVGRVRGLDEKNYGCEGIYPNTWCDDARERFIRWRGRTFQEAYS